MSKRREVCWKLPYPNEEDRMIPEDFLSICKDKVSIGGSTGDITCFSRKAHPVKSKDRKIRDSCKKDIMPITKLPVVSWATYQEMDELSDKYFEKTKIQKDYKLVDEMGEEEFEHVEIQN